MSVQSSSSPRAHCYRPLRTVLIGTSLGDESDQVVRGGLAVARAAGGRVYLVHAAGMEPLLASPEAGGAVRDPPGAEGSPRRPRDARPPRARRAGPSGPGERGFDRRPQGSVQRAPDLTGRRLRRGALRSGRLPDSGRLTGWIKEQARAAGPCALAWNRLSCQRTRRPPPPASPGAARARPPAAKPQGPAAGARPRARKSRGSARAAQGRAAETRGPARAAGPRARAARPRAAETRGRAFAARPRISAARGRVRASGPRRACPAELCA